MEATRDCEDPEDVVDTVWTDYMGGTVYGDFTVVEDEGSPDYTNLNAFLPGIGRVDPHGTPSAVEYYHSNQIGTTRAMTDDGGDDEQGVVYTAFGERVGGTDHRYGYAGAWGYRSHDDFACDAQSPESQFPYLHVGWRYYDPATGRFLQRDPIGIYGGWNVYEYVSSNPLASVDPIGLKDSWWKRWRKYIVDSCITIAGKVAEKLAGASAPAVSGPLVVTVNALDAGPDGVRVWVGVLHRDKSLQREDIEDILDNYDRGRGKYVKPRKKFDEDGGS